LSKYRNWIIAGAIYANSVQAAPAMLAKTAAAAAFAKGATAYASTFTLITGALKVMAWSKAKTAIVVGIGILFTAGTTTIVVVKTQTALNQRDAMAAQTSVMKESAFPAIMKFAQAHQDAIPKSLAELKPYLTNLDGLDDDHWQISASGKLTPLLARNDVILLQQKNVPPGKLGIIVYTDGHIVWK
jgi:hypothetical protein